MPKNRKPYPDGIWPQNPFMENTTTAIPYAGITQVRFKGYLLSLIGTPCAYASFSYSKPSPKSSRFLPAKAEEPTGVLLRHPFQLSDRHATDLRQAAGRL